MIFLNPFFRLRHLIQYRKMQVQRIQFIYLFLRFPLTFIASYSCIALANPDRAFRNFWVSNLANICFQATQNLSIDEWEALKLWFTWSGKDEPGADPTARLELSNLILSLKKKYPCSYYLL